jgi:DNA-binding CsgD family transcriptional regulator
MVTHARASASGAGPDLLLAADAFASLNLFVYAAEAASAAVGRLREVKSPQHGSANRRLGELLERCDNVRTPALGAGRTVLTDRERQIAKLAANGVPSREIADHLYISTRTVENHLQRVYTKLGVTGRPELATALRLLPDS